LFVNWNWDGAGHFEKQLNLIGAAADIIPTVFI
jgi:hypothetical protein